MRQPGYYYSEIIVSEMCGKKIEFVKARCRKKSFGEKGL
jgi:hypothetical protein